MCLKKGFWNVSKLQKCLAGQCFFCFIFFNWIDSRAYLPPSPPSMCSPPSPHFNFSDDNLVDMKNRRKTFHVLPAENYNWYLESSKKKKLMKSFRRWDSTWLNQLMICYETLLPIRICFLLKTKSKEGSMTYAKILKM